MKRVKSVLALILTLLFISQAAVMAAAAAEIQHPRLIVYGQVTKPIYPGRPIFEYKDDQGLSSTLPFERQDKNISISFANIVFDENFENKTVTDKSASTGWSLEASVLGTDNEYILLKITNSSAINANTDYKGYVRQYVDIPITSKSYVLFTAYASESLDSISYALVSLQMLVVDSGGNKHWVTIAFFSYAGTNTIAYSASTTIDSVTTDLIEVKIYGVTSYYTIQKQIGDIISSAGQNFNPEKITRICLFLLSHTASSITDSSLSAIAYIRHVSVTSSVVYIDDGTENGLIVNGTSGNFGYSAGDIINVYGANATKIVGVTIPWQIEVTPEIDKDLDNLRMQYTWEWTMPKSPSEVGDTLTFSNTNMTLYGYKDGDAWDKLYLNGVDKLSSIASKKVPSDADYWTYCLASSLFRGQHVPNDRADPVHG